MLNISQGVGLLKKFKWSLTAALTDAFPEFREEFAATREKHREFLCAFAEERGFDPLIPENWMTVKKKYIMDKVPSLAPSIAHSLYIRSQGEEVLQCYNYSLIRALKAVFPESDFTGFLPSPPTSRNVLTALWTQV